MSGVERRPRDFRGAHLPEVLVPHVHGVRATVRHACPACPLGRPAPFCPVCLGEGTVSTDRLARYAAELERDGG